MAADPKDLHLADLHERAAAAGVSGYRKLGRDELIEALGGSDSDAPGPEPQEDDADAAAPGPEPQEDDADAAGPEADEAADEEADEAADEEADEAADEEADEEADDGVVVEATLLDDDADGPVELGPEGAEGGDLADEDQPTTEARGVLEITRQRYGFLRLESLVPGDADIYVSAAQVRRCELRPGDEVEGPAREPRRGERHRALVHVDRVNGEEPGSEVRPEFDALAPELPGPRVLLDTPGADLLVRAIDLLAPLALGHRVLIRAAPRSGRTTLLRALARAAIADGNARAIVLLIDERPEEAPGWREAVPVAEFAIATSDLAPIEQVRIAEVAIERARRLAEIGENVVFVCDSLSRLAHAAGGVDEVKRLFGTGRNLAGGGSVTMFATTLADSSDEGEAERAVITTESALITLAPELAATGISPAIVPAECRVSNEEELRTPPELEGVRRLRAELADLKPADAASLLRERIESSKTNPELLSSL